MPTAARGSHRRGSGASTFAKATVDTSYLPAAVSLLLFLTVAITAAQPENGATSVWRGVFTVEQAARGESVYREWCASCHGPGLEGADMTPSLVGGAFTANWNQLSVGDLFERIRTTMPLDRPGAVRGQSNADLIAFILKSNAWPAGTSDLPRELAALKQITIESTRP
jgi:cytochrome c